MKAREYTFALTEDEINVILKGLGALPYAEVFQLIQKIHMQAQQQSAAAEPPVTS